MNKKKSIITAILGVICVLIGIGIFKYAKNDASMIAMNTAILGVWVFLAGICFLTFAIRAFGKK